MTSRSRRETISFKHPFRLRSIGRELASGNYEVVTDEDLIEGLSFASYRRVATMMMVPALVPRGAMEVLSVEAAERSQGQRHFCRQTFRKRGRMQKIRGRTQSARHEEETLICR